MRYLFIAGCPRSGTSALTFLLNEHPRVAIGFERYKRLRAQLDPFHFSPEQFFAPVLAETDIRGELLYERLRARWQGGGVEVIGDKVPLYTRVLPHLYERFPGARVLVLVRDPLAVARSFHRRAGDPADWWPAENDHTLAVRMWNEALASVRGLDAEEGEGKELKRTPFKGSGLVALLPYEALFSGETCWLEMLLGFIGVPMTKRLRAEYERSAVSWQAREEGVSGSQDSELRDYVEAHRDEELERWARERMAYQLEVAVRPAMATPEEDEAPLSEGELRERACEQQELLGEMRRPGHPAEDELQVLERRYVAQAGELARRTARGAKLRVTFLAPHQRLTSGGVYVIERLARHMAASGEAEVCLAVREPPSRALAGVDVRFAERLDEDVLPLADVLLYPADMRDAKALVALPARVGRPVMFFQGYGTPASPVVEANLVSAREAVAIARWLVDLALARGVECAYVPQGLDGEVFAAGPPQAEREPRVSLMTHRLDWKGTADALQALELVRKQFPEVQVALFGAEAFAGGSDSFLASPSRAQVAELLRTSAVHVVASWEEGFGLTGAEAIACGAALASTDTKGSRDYAIDGVTALVSAPRDPAALARNVLALLEDVELRARLVAAGQRHLRTVMVPWGEAARRLTFALAQG